MRIFGKIMYTGVSLLAVSTPTFAQDAAGEAPAAVHAGEPAVVDGGEIVVSARRKDESLQDVPLTVNVVSSETIQKLNIRDLKDIASVVPGLTLNPGLAVSGPVASLRGVNVDVIASGNNGTVEFYLNDAPISPGAVLQSIYDVGQIEVLRGPQGTLRGRASPSGSITVTTRRPDMDEFGGYAEGTVTSLDTINVQGAINAPLITDVLAVRVAGLLENNKANRVFSINNRLVDPSAKTQAVRASLLFAPTSNLEFNASYSYLLKNSKLYDQVESLNLALGTPVVGTRVTTRDRAAVMDIPRDNRQSYEIFNWQAHYSFAGQRFDYVGSYSKQDLKSADPLDKGDFFGPQYPGNATSPTQNLQNITSDQHTFVTQESHEFRLSSEERVAGFIDYTVGGLINRLEPPSDLMNRTPVFLGPVTPANFGFIVETPIERRGRTLENALFANLTAHVGEQTEVSGGIRQIHFQDSTNTAPNDVIYNATIWNASVKHRFNDDFMVYGTAGTSWRIGTGTNPLILSRSGITTATITDPFLAELFTPTPERSTSYEIGLRSSLFDRKMTLNVSAYHQKFEGFIFSTPAVYITSFNGVTYDNPARTVSGLAASVPAKVDGIEAEIAYQHSDNFNLGASLSYAKSKITNGQIPCSPASPPASDPPTVADIQGDSPTRQIVACTVNQSASTLAPFNASIQGEYSHPISGEIEGFVRGLANIKGNSKNDPRNPYDDVDAYALVNLYLGVRSDDSSWEVMGYAKNLFNTFRVLSRDTSATGVRTSAGTVLSNYRLITATDPREFGITARMAFGSR